MSKTSWLISEINQSKADAHGGKESSGSVDSQLKIHERGEGGMARNAESYGKNCKALISSLRNKTSQPDHLVASSSLKVGLLSTTESPVLAQTIWSSMKAAAEYRKHNCRSPL